MDLKKLNMATPPNEGSRKDKTKFPHQNLSLSRSKSLYPSTKIPKLYVKVNWKNFDKFKHFYVSNSENVFERFEVTLKIFSSEKSESLVVNGENEHYNVFKFEPNKYWLANHIRIEVKPLMRKIPENPLKLIKLSEIGEESSVSGSERNASELPTLWGEFEYDYGTRVLFNYDESFKNPRFVITDNLALEGLFPIVNLKFCIEIPNNYKFVKLFCQKTKQYKKWFKADLNDVKEILGEKDGDKEILVKYKGHVCPEDNYEFHFIKTTEKFTMVFLKKIDNYKIKYLKGFHKYKHMYKLKSLLSRLNL
uniref:Uncharacterized protein n=1 Tax=Meloidogyne enterolobii TaxID=390850 RepID=A0A6V7WWC3_MELEN|nr:unnamed protein product [Meloidogyne enterolobii]